MDERVDRVQITGSPAIPAIPVARGALTARQFTQIVLATVLAGFLALAAVVAMTAWLLARAQDFGAALNHSYQVENRIAELRVLLERAESGRRGYLLSGEGLYRGLFGEVAPRLLPTLEEVAELTRDNPQQQATIDRLRPVLEEKVALLERSVAQRRSGDAIGATISFQNPRDQTALNELRLGFAELVAEEQVLLDRRTRAQTGNVRLLLAVVTLAGVMLGLLAAVSLWAMRRFARDLDRSQSALRRVNEGLEEAVQIRTADLTRANEEIQRFAYIVSHDLRSPLVNIMGFTSELEEAAKPLQKQLAEIEAGAPELVLPEAKETVETELPEAIQFIRSSTQKMDRLINAILKLSREGRRTLAPEPLGVHDMVQGVVESLRYLADEKGAEIEIEGTLPSIVSDRVAVEQVLSNLIENALKYLKPGRPGRVRIRGREEPGRVVYEVEDNGRGIDPRDHERVFELFRRAGAQDQPGEGIGLAHVRALAHRLGGVIECVSELDRGATFRLSLPPVLLRDAGGRRD